MSKKRHKTRRPKDPYSVDAESFEPYVSPETKRAIVGIVLTVISALIILSLFHLAGSFGVFLNEYLMLGFGMTRFFIPILLIAFAYAILRREDEPKFNYASGGGLVLLLLSVASFIHLISSKDPKNWSIEGLEQGGGYLALPLSFFLFDSIGKLASLMVLGSTILIAILLIFNTSLHELARKFFFWLFWIPKFFSQLFKIFRHKETESFRDTDNFDETEPLENESNETFGQDEFAAKGATLPDENLPFKKVDIEDQKELMQQTLLNRRKRKKIDVPLDLLNSRLTKPTSLDIKTTATKIQKTLANFDIPVDLGDTSVGPTVTQFTIKPADGIKLSRITALDDDLALALAAHPVRIEAPIPGKSLVGIEVPNQTTAIVNLREILVSEEFLKSRGKLMIALGKDVTGKPWLADLSQMPHLLIAGATGSGKTIGINSIILSLIFQYGPDDLKFVLIDPKRVELTLYNGIPHLLTPVITEIKKTINSLKWCILEMERRFELLAKFHKRDIGSYNRDIATKMPFIVLIIDELADLMVASGNEVEAGIIRLAQMARAVGIHLILATQRPSVDVITGLIKANITARIAFSVASLIDSRTILDASGAEKLLGRGDMLFMTSQLAKSVRIQGAYVSEEEVKRVVEYLKEKYEDPEYDEDITEINTQVNTIFKSGSGEMDDELFESAKEIVIQSKKASASLLQRRLKVGYARAARLIDALEAEGIIGPGDGAKPRDVRIDQKIESAIIEDDEVNLNENKN
jgi:S-DNA-T family DNA segregation ATPase FtsK/SpoIIIE